MQGVPLAAVAKYLGDSVEMVMRYSHLQPEVKARAVEAAMSFYPKQDKTKQNKGKKNFCRHCSRSGAGRGLSI